MNPLTAAAPLAANCRGPIVLPHDADYDTARSGWNLAADRRPAAVVTAADVADVQAVVAHAAAAGLRVVPQATGHQSDMLRPLDDAILLRTSGLRGVEIDPVLSRCRVAAGVLWADVVAAAAAYGLAPLAGSSPDVSVVGYSLGGGIGWLGRRYGLQSNSVIAVELVTADGQLVRADARNNAELFWALRGGKRAFGVVTALEFSLYPVADVYGGALVWDWSHAREVLGRWVAWCADAPAEITTSARIIQFPPLAHLPEHLRGRKVVMIDGACCASDAVAEEILRPLRELRPDLDSFARMPTAGLVRLHGDPEDPVPGKVDHRLLDSLDDDALDAFVALAGADSGSPLMIAELRQLGGSLALAPAGHGALGALGAGFLAATVGVAMTPAMTERVVDHATRLLDALAPWDAGRAYLNFAGRPTDATAAFDAVTVERLEAVRAIFDPGSRFAA